MQVTIKKEKAEKIILSLLEERVKLIIEDN